MKRCAMTLAFLLTLSAAAYGQNGLRESLEKLDRNKDGYISPEEVTPLSRPFLERITRARRLSLERPNTIDRLLDAARTHYSIQNGVWGKDVRPEGEPSVKKFGPERDKNMVPEFGIPNMKYEYTLADLEEADATIRRYDRNRDGYIDRREAIRSRWTHRSPFEMDLNNDDRLSRLELAQRYARRRMLTDDVGELYRKAVRSGASGVRPSIDQAAEEKRRLYEQSGQLRYVASSVMGRFDRNRNGRLEADEATAMGVDLGLLDKNGDGQLSQDELQQFFADLNTDEDQQLEGLPPWFFALDANRDRQVAMSEFTDDWTEAKIREFESLDLNGDGLLTTDEAIEATSLGAGSGFRNNIAEVLAPRKTVISEIEVTEDYLIGDLDVQISITHTNVGYLDGYLVGPDGHRVELFTEVGGSGNHFEKTVFDDQAKYPINKAKAPYPDRYIPEGVANKQPGLDSFKGKSVRGVWQLIIRGARNDRFGMLHGWGLIARREGEIDGDVLSRFQEPTSTAPAEPTKTPYLNGVREFGRNEILYNNRKAAVEAQREAARKTLLRDYMEAAKARAAGQLNDEDWAKFKSEIGERKKKLWSGGEKEEKREWKSERKSLEKSAKRDIDAKRKAIEEKMKRKASRTSEKKSPKR